MNPRVLLITPPFTQLNTPYPATAYLKGFLNTKQIASAQYDLGIEVILQIFSQSGLEHLFNFVQTKKILNASENSKRILALKDEYISSIHHVISFLQGNNSSCARLICQGSVLAKSI